MSSKSNYEEWQMKKKKQAEINRKHFHAIVDLLGMDETFELLQHIGVSEEYYDVDEGCGVRSCRHCGACGSYENLINWKELKDPDGKQLSQMDDENELFGWDITCSMCGESWAEFLHKVE